MGFVKFDEMADEHPKVIAAVEQAGEAAGWLWFRSVLYSSRAMTDGFVHAAKARELAGGKSLARRADALVACGLWEIVEGGWQVHDYTEHNTTAAKRKEARRNATARVQRHRARNGDVTALHGRSVTPSSRSLEVEGEEEGTTDSQSVRPTEARYVA